MLDARETLYLLSLLGQLVFAGNDLHRVCLSVALVLDERDWAVWPHFPCMTETVITHLFMVMCSVCKHPLQQTVHSAAVPASPEAQQSQALLAQQPAGAAT